MVEISVIPLDHLPHDEGVELRREQLQYFVGQPEIWNLYRGGKEVRALNRFESAFVDAALKAAGAVPRVATGRLVKGGA